jgi:hypothetical protein
MRTPPYVGSDYSDCITLKSYFLGVSSHHRCSLSCVQTPTPHTDTPLPHFTPHLCPAPQTASLLPLPFGHGEGYCEHPHLPSGANGKRCLCNHPLREMCIRNWGTELCTRKPKRHPRTRSARYIHTKSDRPTPFGMGGRSVGVSGLEPEKTGPESVVLPITPYPKLSSLCISTLAVCECKGSIFL